MRMEDIRYFIQVAQSGSINRTASRCFITQQGLSRIIANMEKELGTHLFQRDGKKLKLTPTGRIVLDGFIRLDALYAETLNNIAMQGHINAAEMTAYTIWATPVICLTCLPHILRSLSAEFPFVSFNVIEKSPLTIFDELDYTENSIAIASGTEFLQKQSRRLAQGTVCFDRCFQDELCCCAHESNPLADKSIVSIEELSRLPLVCHNTEMLMAEHLLGRHLNPSMLTNTTNHTLCRTIVQGGRAVGMTSTLLEHYENANDSIVQIPINKSIRIDYGCVFSPSVEPNRITQGVIAAVKKELSFLKSE